MASSWGDSWGSSWGDSWGKITIEPIEQVGGGGSMPRIDDEVRNDDDRVIMAVVEKFLMLVNKVD